jgi:hypothetical protein
MKSTSDVSPLTLHRKGIRTKETIEAHNKYRRDRYHYLRNIMKEEKHTCEQYDLGCRCLMCLEANHHRQYEK